VVGNLLKPLFGRPQPRHHWTRKPQVIKGAFPSGHAAAEVAYVFGASLEAPATFVPLGTMALLAHLSLVKAGKHYISDTLGGGIMGLAVVALMAQAWPPGTISNLLDPVTAPAAPDPATAAEATSLAVCEVISSSASTSAVLKHDRRTRRPHSV
jgi:membrane-associated phospholipid phosphatase